MLHGQNTRLSVLQETRVNRVFNCFYVNDVTELTPSTAFEESGVGMYSILT